MKNELRIKFHCYILIPWKFPRKTLFQHTLGWGMGRWGSIVAKLFFQLPYLFFFLDFPFFLDAARGLGLFPTEDSDIFDSEFDVVPVEHPP